MTAPSILVVDDQYLYSGVFQDLFPGRVDFCQNVEELRQRLDDGQRWGHVFVDFDLGPGPTGLSALQLLEKTGCVPVTYSSVRESGRLLYMYAAQAWFGVTAHLDKQSLDPAQIEDVVARLDRGQRRLYPLGHEERFVYADHINWLFKRPYYVHIWPALIQSRGFTDKVVKLAGVSRHKYDDFRLSTSETVPKILSDLFGIEDSSMDIAGKTSHALAFGAQNYAFFDAPDLIAVVTELSQRDEGLFQPPP